MEVGAVKQAFNNEVIHLKQKLNQARIQVINKLTRKAKTLVGKKAPEKLQEKLKRKAESAVKEVMILKKIKPKDVAKFSVTHTGDLKTFLNRPNVDIDKACARLLLHKALQDKYLYIRKTYSNVPIEDLLMSRLERRKLKKEEKEKQKNKKKEKQSRTKNNSISSEPDWTVEDIKSDGKGDKKTIGDEDDLSDESELSEAENESVNEFEDSENESIDENKSKVINKGDEDEAEEEIDDKSDIDNSDHESVNNDTKSSNDGPNSDDHDGKDDTDDKDVDNKAKSSYKSNSSTICETVESPVTQVKQNTKANKKELNKKPAKEDNRAKLPKINKEKNKKQLEKITSKKFKKETEETVPVSNKVVDSFFITASGGNYMSLAEPRAPDEVKEVHQQGNRKLRRAVMFGHEVKSRPRPYNNRNGYNEENDRFNRNNRTDGKSNGYDRHNNSNFDKSNNSFDRRDNKNGFRNSKFEHQDKFSSNDRNNRFDKKADLYKKKDLESKEEKSAVPEKLHPSWEAKKKNSTIVPFQGKKIKFDEG